jgi:hypothetical protein
MGNLNKFSLVKTNEFSEWDSFVEHSPEGTIFSTTGYLDAIGRKFALFYVYKGSTIAAGVCLILSDDGSSSELDSMAIYGGILFSPKDPQQNFTSRLSDEFEITTFLIPELLRFYEKIEIALVPSFKDLRPFLWHNYFEADSKKCKVDLRYTSYLDILRCTRLNDDDSLPLFQNIGYSRRQEIRHARRDKVSAKESQDISVLVDLYCHTLKNQGIEVPKKKRDVIVRIGNQLLATKRGTLITVDNAKRTTVSAGLFCWDNKMGYYLIGASHPAIKERYSGTMLLWDSFSILQNKGISILDLEGVNSPQRGWFKLSFGGTLTPYYKIHWQR